MSMVLSKKSASKRLYAPFPEELWELIENADYLTLYLLYPEFSAAYEGKQTFHGYPVLRQVELDEEESLTKVVEVLRKGIYGKSNPKRCWVPHHGIRTVAGSKSVDLVMCFVCEVMQYFVSPRSKKFVWGQVGKLPKKVLNGILRKTGIPPGTDLD
jgi:hypothetical protein